MSLHFSGNRHPGVEKQNERKKESAVLEKYATTKTADLFMEKNGSLSIGSVRKECLLCW